MENSETTTNEVKKRAISVQQTLKSFSGNIKKLEEAKMADEKEVKQLKELFKKFKERWIGMDLEM